MKTSDYERTWQFCDLLRERDMARFGVAQTEKDCTIHLTIGKEHISFDFDEDDKLVNVRRS